MILPLCARKSWKYYLNAWFFLPCFHYSLHLPTHTNLTPRSISGTLAQMIAFLQTASVTYTAPVHWNGFDDMFISVSYPTQTANSSQVR
jgi:hypothetical protein